MKEKINVFLGTAFFFPVVLTTSQMGTVSVRELGIYLAIQLGMIMFLKEFISNKELSYCFACQKAMDMREKRDIFVNFFFAIAMIFNCYNLEIVFILKQFNTS